MTVPPTPPFPEQHQDFPGLTSKMDPKPDHGEDSYVGSGQLAGKHALITGGDSGIGAAVALAFAREGADVAIAYLPEEQGDAEAIGRLIEAAGVRALLVPGDIAQAGHAGHLVDTVVAAFGGIDILVNNAAYQAWMPTLADITMDEWRRHFDVNVHAAMDITLRVVPQMAAGGSVIFTSSVNSKHPMPTLIPYSATKATLANMTLGLAQALAEKGVRVNAVLPGPIWTPFIPAGMDAESVTSFGSQSPMGRPAQPAELASAYVMLASDRASFTTGALLTVAGGMPIF
jgi:NAD(P)-dependent dehydrogenase (short-subunit alcohol dehydrogenase family)